MSGDNPRPVRFFNAGFLRQRRIARILALAGYPLRAGLPGAADLIAVWGRSPYASRGEAMAARSGAGLLRVEDAFLRSLHPGRDGEPPMGLVLDRRGIYFDAARPSDLEHLLATHPLDDASLLARARGALAMLREAHLSKYSAVDPDVRGPGPGHVLVIDQTRHDASIRHGGADADTFRHMLARAIEEHPQAPIVIKTHPETARGHREGHYGPKTAGGRVTRIEVPISPWRLLDGARAVYTVSSQMGFEAICAGHRPQVFGQPFYAGWGLSDDCHPAPLPRRGRALRADQLFAAAMILYPVWYDPHRDRLCPLEDAIAALAAAARCWREDRKGWDAYGMRLWKRGPLRRAFGRHAKVTFPRAPQPDSPRRAMVWAGRGPEAPEGAVRVEDGFLRSRGLGAELVPPLSLVCDDLGIYYDPARPSRLEALIAARADLRPDQRARALRLIARLRETGVTKYTPGGGAPDLPDGHRILVPGQVADDASIRLGAGRIATDLALLRLVRARNPGARILYRPHPDVTAGLRPGGIAPGLLKGLADPAPAGADPAALLDAVDEVWTMTSLMGFEALLRGVRVTTTGAPFYAGWGLTRDLGDPPARRRARPGLAGLVHAALIDYPRYFDPVTGTACPVEVAVDRLARGPVPHPGAANRLLSKLQGVLASRAEWWR